MLLASKHFINHLKSNYGLRDGLIGHLDKILYSTADADTTYLLQILCQGKNEISVNRIYSIIREVFDPM